MDEFRVVSTPEADEFFEGSDRVLQRKLDRCFQQLRRDPRRHNMIKPLRGPQRKGQWRYRIDDWRVLYIINDATRTVTIFDIAHRSEVYD